MRIVLTLLVSAPLWAGCGRPPTVILDPTIPHQVAEPVTVEVWARRPDGRMQRVRAHVDAGWWVASPQAVEDTGELYPLWDDSVAAAFSEAVESFHILPEPKRLRLGITEMLWKDVTDPCTICPKCNLPLRLHGTTLMLWDPCTEEDPNYVECPLW